jgi:hypothetical protein
LSHDEIDAVEASSEELAEGPEWEQEMIAKATEVLDSADYLQLPGKFELHEWRIMEKFCFA